MSKQDHFISGEQKAWTALAAMDAVETAKNTGVDFDNDSRSYLLKSLNSTVGISPLKKEFICNDENGRFLTERLGYFFRLSALVYMTTAKDISLSGRLINPSGMKGGEIYFRGSHILPLDKLAQKYETDKQGFISRALELGGAETQYGDAGVILLPLPKLPIYLNLWLKDDEFPARCDIMFDSTCEMQLPLDIIWSVAMMTILAML
ncbi:MAG: DUF3786 domain-containing protein [Dissulfurispiraceae bacterium]|nr:DUF3786 domain-containing protein [Dissulfurispiraceae bacterium]